LYLNQDSVGLEHPDALACPDSSGGGTLVSRFIGTPTLKALIVQGFCHFNPLSERGF